MNANWHFPYCHALSPITNKIGRGGSLVDSLPFVRRVAGLNPTLAAT